MKYLFSSYNAFVSYAKTIGIGKRAWVSCEMKDRYIGGGRPNLANFPVGSVVQEGTPCYFDEIARTVALHISFEVYETAALNATSIKVKKNLNNSVARSGMYVMVAPATVAGTGTGITVSAVDTSNAAYDVFTVGALAAEITAGTILVEADKSGSGAVTLVQPNGLIVDDIYKDANAPYFSANVAFAGVIKSRIISPISAAIKASLPKIQFLNNK